MSNLTALLRPRNLFFITAFGCLDLIIVALIMQEFMGLEPCPLCITQRVCIILVGVLALIAALHNPKALGQRFYAAGMAIFAIAGGFFASRQLWLQGLPEDEVPACGPSISYVLETFPLLEALEVLLSGDGNCAEVAWTFLGLSIPGWTLIAFAGLLLIALWQLIQPKVNQQVAIVAS